jgi:hypothetical protein
MLTSRILKALFNIKYDEFHLVMTSQQSSLRLAPDKSHCL